MISKLVEAFDALPEPLLICLNSGLALFVLLAHGGYMALMLHQGNEIEPWLFVTIPLAILFIISGVIALASKRTRTVILKFHALLLLVSTLWALYYGISLLVNGIPEGNFSWGLGMYTIFCTYPVYLARRTLFHKHFNKVAIIKYSHVLMLIIALLIDVSVLISMGSQFESRMERAMEQHMVK